MPARRLAVWLVLCTAAAFSQTLPTQTLKKTGVLPAVRRMPAAALAARPAGTRVSSSDTLRVLALMVDFQTSVNNFVDGNGRFQLDPVAFPAALDRAPHDSAYFAYKLLFLSNYFRKVSNGKVNIKGDVFGHVITLSNAMASYSPPKDGSNNKPLANLIVESWHLADSLYPSIQFGKYDAFVIFHAGVGRDVDLVPTLGYDPAPFDIPSITFSLQTLQQYLGNPAYSGVPVSNGAFRVTNTLLLPETESRVLFTSIGTDTIQISINDLLANSFGSYLGLPDLFDTKTGAAATGDFGLMDPAAVINFYSGLFPPEPSAWEKIYLGWVKPITLGAGTTTISLPAVGLKAGPDTIYKVPISDHEYFLVENRSRDPQQNGELLTIRQGNSIVTRRITTDTIGFNFEDVSSISGSVIDVEDFDWALPGYPDTSRVYSGGGVLIWHIDENIIAQTLSSNSVNADPLHRGVDLEEADGPQDIGQSYDPLSGAAFAELGWPLDFWFAANPDSVYRNIFDASSYPSSRAYGGALSLVTIRDFSQRSPHMKAVVQIGDTQFQRLQKFTRQIQVKGTITPPAALSSGVLLGVDGKMYAFRNDGSSRTKDSTGFLFAQGGAYSPVASELAGGLMVVGVQDSAVYVVNSLDQNGDGIVDSVRSTKVSVGEPVSTPPMLADLSVSPSIVVGGAKGSVWQFSYAGVLQRKIASGSSSPVASLAQLSSPSLSKPADLFFTCAGKLFSEQSSVSLGDSSLPWILAGVPSRSGDFLAAAQWGGQRVLGYNRLLTQKMFDLSVGVGSISSVVAADIDGDGENDVVVLTGDRLYAFSRTGVTLAAFPLTPPLGSSFVGTPLIADLNGDGSNDIIVPLSTGGMSAYARDGHTRTGFPVQLTSGGVTNLALFASASGKIGVVGASATGSIQAVELSGSSSSNKILWSQFLSDGRHSNAGPANDTVAVSVPVDFLPASRVYNWPNPVYGQRTQIRYYTPEDAAISIKIFDLAGVKIAELNSLSKGGLDGEVSWDVSSVQSGVYLARVEAAGSNRSQVAIVKIAVVK